MRRAVIIVLIALVVIFAIVQFVLRPGKDSATEKTGDQSVVVNNPALSVFQSALETAGDEESVLKFKQVVNDYPESELAPQALLEIARVHDKSGSKLEKKQVLGELLTRFPDSSVADEGRRMLWQTNIDVLLSPLPTEKSMVYEIQSGDTLYRIAQRFHTTVELLMESNNLSSSLIRPGMKLKVPAEEFKVRVDKSDNKLVLENSEGEIVKIYSVSTGADNCTPVGEFKIVNRIINPVWYKTGAIVDSSSPENILGTRWLGFSEPGYGIHGTVEPETIGQQVTQGCVRMRNQEVEELFKVLPVGTEVIITD